MAKLVDRVVETTQTVGTGTLDLDGNVAGYRSFSDEVTSGQKAYYVIEDNPDDPTEYEEGIGTFTSGGPNTLSRDTVLKSSNGGNKISLQSGTTYTVTGAPVAQALNGAFGSATLASAATVNIGAADGHVIQITGTTAITAFDTVAAGTERILVFAEALTLTHNATSLILPEGANITTAAGDVARFVSEGSGNWRCTNYSPPVGVLKSGVEDQVISGGATVTSKDLTEGNITIDCGDRPLQYINNNGAFTITAPAADGSCLLMVTNGASAGAITFSGFSVGSNTGDALTTTNGHIFTISIWRINGVSGYRIAAHQ